MWVSSLNECGHAFEAVREGLLSLENAFFELAGGLGSFEERMSQRPDLMEVPRTTNGAN